MSSSESYLKSIKDRVKYLKHRRYENSHNKVLGVRIDMYNVAETVVAIRYMFREKEMSEVPVVKICGGARNTWLEIERRNRTYELNDGDWLLITSSSTSDRKDVQSLRGNEVESDYYDITDNLVRHSNAVTISISYNSI